MRMTTIHKINHHTGVLPSACSRLTRRLWRSTFLNSLVSPIRMLTEEASSSFLGILVQWAWYTSQSSNFATASGDFMKHSRPAKKTVIMSSRHKSLAQNTHARRPLGLHRAFAGKPPSDANNSFISGVELSQSIDDRATKTQND